MASYNRKRQTKKRFNAQESEWHAVQSQEYRSTNVTPLFIKEVLPAPTPLKLSWLSKVQLLFKNLFQR